MKLIFTILLLGAITLVTAQISNPPELEQQLAGKTNFRQITGIVHTYYNNQLAVLPPTDSIAKKRINRQLKMWHRWEFFNEPRLDANGDIVNVNQRTWEAYEKLPDAGAFTNATETSYGVWSEIGPTSYTRTGGYNGGMGRVNCIAFHPTDVNTFFIGCPAGGLWKTTNNGASWTNLADHIPSTGISGIVVSHSNANVIYILTGDGDGGHRNCIGVLKSTDGGVNWSPTGSFPGSLASGWLGYKLLQHPTNASILFAVTNTGIYKTTDAAVTWVRVNNGGTFTDIEFKPGDPTIMYAVRTFSTAPFLRSTNTGDNWSTAGITDVPTNAWRLAIGVSAANPNYVYLLAGPATAAGVFVGVYRSFDSGLDFDLRASTPNIMGYPNNGLDDAHQNTYDIAIEVNPTNVAQVLTGGINVWGSTNFGVTFTYRTQWDEPTPAGQYVHADIHNLAYNPLNNRLYVCSDGGVSYSDNNGSTWTIIWNGLQIAQYYNLSGNSADQNLLIGGLQDNGTMYKKSASFNFDHVDGADGYTALIDYSNTNNLYFTQNGVLNKSTNGGATVSYGNLAGGSWPSLAMHVTNSAILFAGRSDGVYKSINSAGSWVNTGGRGETEVLTCPSNNQRVYGLGNGLLYRSDTEGGGWVNVSGNPGYPGGDVSDIAVSPFNSLNVWICVGGYSAGVKVYSSTDGGANWTNRSGSLPNAAATAVAVDNNGGVYVGTDVGVFYRDPASGNWLPFYNWLPKVPISDIVLNQTANTITVATFGRGLWRTDQYSACTPSISLGGAVSGTRFYEASDNIVTTHVLQGGQGTEFIYRAGSYVRMDPGFEVKAGNKMKAFIGPCATGIPGFSRLATDYGIKDQRELLVKALRPYTGTPPAEKLTLLPGADGETELVVTVPEEQFVQLYYEAADHEIIAWLIRDRLKQGVYSIKLRQDKLKGKGPVTLRLLIGGQEQFITL
jgi:hypothetical protein